jgi:hypothetical protein
MAPKSRLADLLVFKNHLFITAVRTLGLSLYAANGFGCRTAYIASIFALALAWAMASLNAGNKLQLAFLGALMAIYSIWPETTQLSSLLIFAAVVAQDSRSCLAITLSSILCETGYFGLDYVALVLVSLVAAISLLPKFSSLTIRRTSAFACLYILLCIYNLIVPLQLSVPERQSFSYPYRIGEALNKALGLELKENGLYLIDNDHTKSDVKPSTIYSEHDIDAYEGTAIAVDNYTQTKRWKGRQYLGAENIRLSLSKDGYHALNFGSELKLKGLNVLSHQDWLKITPVAVVDDGILFFGDSDAFVNRLVPYQVNFLNTLQYGTCYVKSIHLLLYLVIFLFLAMTSTLKRPLLFFIPIILVISLNLLDEQRGDIRLVSNNRGWPHTVGMYGIARHSQDSGFNYLFGNEGTRILALDRGMNGTLRDQEEVVIMGSSSKLKHSKGFIYAGETPMGTSSEIEDAYRIFNDSGSLLGIGTTSLTLNSRDITIISTNSPTKLDPAHISLEK